jgi:alpha-tubulin suppressor-like RCC1 family protein
MDGCAIDFCFHVPKTERKVIVIYSVYGRLVQWTHSTQQHISKGGRGMCVCTAATVTSHMLLGILI